jgi:NSS family neurotransmitter:Na+ symporter
MFFLFMSFAAYSTVIAVFENIISYWIDVRQRPPQACLQEQRHRHGAAFPPLHPRLQRMERFHPVWCWDQACWIGGFHRQLHPAPIGSLLFCLFCTRKIGWGWDNFLQEADQGTGLKFPAGHDSGSAGAFLHVRGDFYQGISGHPRALKYVAIFPYTYRANT